PVSVKRVDKGAARAAARVLLERVGLSDKAGALPMSLSGGQKQRVAIARALAMEPELLMFDEATSALDPALVREVLDVMRSVAADGMTMLVVTHEMGFARDACTRIIFMDGGEVGEDTDPGSFLTRPRSERAKRFLNQIEEH